MTDTPLDYNNPLYKADVIELDKAWHTLADHILAHGPKYPCTEDCSARAHYKHKLSTIRRLLHLGTEAQ